MIPMRVAAPVDSAGRKLPPGSAPLPYDSLDTENPFHPFSDRLSHDFADTHFVKMQSSSKEIRKGLDLWLAAKIEATGDPNCARTPWKNAREMHRTIDQIQQGNVPFKTIEFQYSGPRPSQGAPSWMTQKYELCVRDLREVIHQQLATEEFADEFCTTPYRQFDGASRERVFTNLFSGEWAWNEAVFKQT